MMGQQPENISCDGGAKFHCESTCQLTSAELVMVHSTYSTSAIYLLCLFWKFSNPRLSPSLSPFSLSPSFFPQVPLPSLLPSIVVLHPEKQKHFSLCKTTPLYPCCSPPFFPEEENTLEKETLRWWSWNTCTWVHGFNSFNLSQTRKLIGLPMYTICHTKLLKGQFLLPPTSSHVDMSKVTVCHSWVTWLFHYNHQFLFLRSQYVLSGSHLQARGECKGTRLIASV